MRRPILFLGLIFLLGVFYSFENPYHSRDISKYKIRAEDRYQTGLPSRRWMAFTVDLVKVENPGPPTAARVYSYVASVYSDVLEETNNSEEASFATADIIKFLYPKYLEKINEFLSTFDIKLQKLSPQASAIVEIYKKRAREDNFQLTWDGKIPEGLWYVRNGRISDPRAQDWKTWILPENKDFRVPPPPKEGSLKDQVEIEKVIKATQKRSIEDTETVIFWHSAGGRIKGQNGDNITPAGTWQDILFTEVADVSDDASYSKAQKILAQTLADSFITAWGVKFKYWSERPSMRIPDLNLVVSDPDFPAYVSGHSTISKAAAIILTHLYPQKKSLWHALASDAKNSRLVAGIHFDIDNQEGEKLGEKIGKEILSRLYPEKYHSQYYISGRRNDNSFVLAISLATLKISNYLSTQLKAYLGLVKDFLAPTPSAKFKDVAEEAGVSKPLAGGGAAWGDFDNDSYLDLFVTSISPPGNYLYRNQGDGTFKEVTKGANLFSPTGSWGLAWGDFDNDGCLDVYVVKLGSNKSLESGENDRLYKNNCDGTFTDVTFSAGIVEKYHGRGIAWGDYNNDGYLDIYVANHGIPIEGKEKEGIFYTSEPNILYRNNKDGTFNNVAKELGVEDFSGTLNHNTITLPARSGVSFQPIWFDYDGNGTLDLFVATDGGVSPLFRNNGNGIFSDVTEEAGINVGGTGMGVAVGDYDGDLDLDFYQTNYDENYLWKNNGNGTFNEVAQKAKVANNSLGWATLFFDFDNDADLDLYVINGSLAQKLISQESKRHGSRDALYENEGEGKFSEVTKKAGVSDFEVGTGAAFADYNNDGFLDVFVDNDDGTFHTYHHKHGLNDETFNRGENLLFKNLGNKNNWISVELIGTKSNRNGIGAKVRIRTGKKTQIQQVISGSSFLSQNSLWPHFGLGKARLIDEIEVTWPSGKVQTIKNIKPNQKIVITEN